MSWTIPSHERLQCPAEYQEHITAIGGLNRFNEPNFRIVWGQTPTDTIYGVDANGRKGQHVILAHGGIPAWFVEVWKPPECFGTPELWYAISWDPEVNKHTLGAYPWQGMYMPAPFNLYVKKFENGVMTFDAMPLTHWIIDLLVPNLLKSIDETYIQKKTAIQNRMAAEKLAARKQAMDAYLDAQPAFGGAAGTHQSNREAWEARIQAKQRGMKISAEEIKKLLGTGHKQIN